MKKVTHEQALAAVHRLQPNEHNDTQRLKNYISQMYLDSLELDALRQGKERPAVPKTFMGYPFNEACDILDRHSKAEGEA